MTSSFEQGGVLSSPSDLERLKFDVSGLVPVVSQDRVSGAVLMVAWADQPALVATLESGKAHFFSRSRQQLWCKGETSGNVLFVQEIRYDCDGDTLLYRVDPQGPACHTGKRTCFDGEAAGHGSVDAWLELGWLAAIVEDRASNSDGRTSYTSRLLEQGIERVAQKVGEEAVEVVIAALSNSSSGDDATAEVAGEAADLLYHLVVLLQARGIPIARVADELRLRHQLRQQEIASHE